MLRTVPTKAARPQLTRVTDRSRRMFICCRTTDENLPQGVLPASNRHFSAGKFCGSFRPPRQWHSPRRGQILRELADTGNVGIPEITARRLFPANFLPANYLSFTEPGHSGLVSSSRQPLTAPYPANRTREMLQSCGCLLLPLLMLSSPLEFAQAAEPATNSNEKSAAALFTQLDVNQDGQLTNDEATGDKERLFKRLVRTSDKDGNGSLNLDEFSSGLSGDQPATVETPTTSPVKVVRAGTPGGIFQRLDTNHDGKIVREEMPETRREAFGQMLKRADANRDSALNQQEFAQLRPSTDRPEEASKSKPDRAETEVAPQDDVDRLVRRALAQDQNGDSQLAFREASKFLQKDFVEIDKNRDGQLDAEELKARFVRAQKKQRAKPDKSKKSNKSPK